MMNRHPANERIKREYFAYLKQAHGRDATTIDRVAASLAGFEASTKWKGFDRFHRGQAVAFKARLAERRSVRTGGTVSKATALATLRDLRAFFLWLAREPGFKSRIAYSDADYFNMSSKDTAIAGARREKAFPTIDQLGRVLAAMPIATVQERRDRALVALAAITAARVNALASFRLEHIDLAGGFVEQDARAVRTKNAKTFRTYYMPFVPGALEIVGGWVAELKANHLWGPGDALFPPTRVAPDAGGVFAAAGLLRQCWATSAPVRAIFQRAFAAADLPYFHPHSLRDTLVHYGMGLQLTPEAMKALSQNIGHEHVLTTLTSYGHVATHRQGELIRGLRERQPGAASADQIAALEAMLRSFKAGGTYRLPEGGDAR